MSRYLATFDYSFFISFLAFISMTHPKPASCQGRTCSGKAFTLDSLRAKDIILIKVKKVIFLLPEATARLFKMLSIPLFVLLLKDSLPVRFI